LIEASRLGWGEHSDRLFSSLPEQAEGDSQSGHALVYFFCQRERGLPIDTSSAEITKLLMAWGSGDESALKQLADRVYPELRRMARRYMKNEGRGNTLQATAVVHEVYLRLIDVTKVDWRARGQFFAMAAQMMRHILVDAARARGAQKRGGAAQKVNFDETVVVAPALDPSILDIDEALNAFSVLAPRQAKVVELRYFGGLSEEEIVAALNISPRTVRRDWDFAKVWLSRELSQTRRGVVEPEP
jgi:RNA polymerase sigma factor (TIGR02999 family)